MDRVVRRAIEEGIVPLVAIQMATMNGGRVLRLRHDLGSIAPGRLADILFVEDLRDFRPHGCSSTARRRAAWAMSTRATLRVHPLGTALDCGDLKIEASGERVRVRAIGVASGTVTTEHVVIEAPVVDGGGAGVCGARPRQGGEHRAARRPGTIGLGFVTGFGLKRGAVGSTVAHDNHNVLVMGMSDADMILAVERLAEVGGGMIAVADGEVLALVELRSRA